MSVFSEPQEFPLPNMFTEPVTVLRPARQTVPVVLASPHSGREYPPEFLENTGLSPLALRSSEDSFVDELFADAPSLGAPLVAANFPRAFLDANREPFELDPAMFTGPLPDHANTRSARVAGGLGTIARVVSNGQEIYRRKLSFGDAQARIDGLYAPYHSALGELLEETHKTFGFAILLDCHSMPSVGGAGDVDIGISRPDIVLGDRYGSSCSAALTVSTERQLKAAGFSCTRNVPYAGGFTTEHYGNPRVKIHALQLELNRALYMDQSRIERLDGFGMVRERVAQFLQGLFTAPLLHA